MVENTPIPFTVRKLYYGGESAEPVHRRISDGERQTTEEFSRAHSPSGTLRMLELYTTHNRGRNYSQRHLKIPKTPRQATSRTPSNDISRSPRSGRALTTATASSTTTAVIATASQFERVHVIVIVTISDSSSIHRGRRSLQQTTATVSDVASIPTPAVDSELSPLTFQSIGVTEHAIDRDDLTSQDTDSSDKVWSLDAATQSTSTSDDQPWFRSNRDRRRRSAERLVAERTFRADDVISVSAPHLSLIHI